MKTLLLVLLLSPCVSFAAMTSSACHDAGNGNQVCESYTTNDDLSSSYNQSYCNKDGYCSGTTTENN